MPFARKKDPATSKLAASRVKNVLSTRDVVLDIMTRKGPMIDAKLISEYQKAAAKGKAPMASESGIRTRRSELVQLGQVIATDKVAKTPYGRAAVVWAAKKVA